MLKNRFGYITANLGNGMIVVLGIFFLALQITCIHGVSLLLGIGYVAAFFVTILSAAIIPFSEVAIIAIGLYGLVDLVSKP